MCRSISLIFALATVMPITAWAKGEVMNYESTEKMYCGDFLVIEEITRGTLSFGDRTVIADRNDGVHFEFVARRYRNKARKDRMVGFEVFQLSADPILVQMGKVDITVDERGRDKRAKGRLYVLDDATGCFSIVKIKAENPDLVP